MKNNKLTIGILAHVDAGKTTLSETILFQTGSIRKMGRVDHKDAFLDTFEIEKARGITIFSKQAMFKLNHLNIVLVDTPGHVDFSSEMERTLKVLDYAVLLVNAADGIQGHTQTLWKLLQKYAIPTYIFVNKMDQVGTNREKLLSELQYRFHDECIDFNGDMSFSEISEAVAMSDEKLMEKYIENEILEKSDIANQIQKRKIFPIYFGSALKNEGVNDLLDGIASYVKIKTYPKDFGARVFKITRDEQGNRLTHVKITGGSLKVKEVITKENYSEKVDQIRLYSGKQFELIQEVFAGSICTLTGLTLTSAGEGLGFEADDMKPILEPVLSYRVVLDDQTNAIEMLKNLKQLEEEEPHLNVFWNKKFAEIYVKVMGEIEIEILTSTIKERFNTDVTFDSGNLVYKETIKTQVVGVGHFEPLRHYSEVHLLMEPGENKSGMVYDLNCSEDILARNWQRLILSHLNEKAHSGVLTGSELTDMKITVIAGRAHNKHTEGGDFRQATFRAIRQGLMKAESQLLEPVYEFRIELPREFLGRALSDIEKMQGRYANPVIDGEEALIEGIAPVSTMMHYMKDVNAYTKGMGRLFLELSGYEPCHNESDIIEKMNYNPDEDYENLSSSVFCKKGTGFSVPWDEVETYMHVESEIKIKKVKTDAVLEVQEFSSNMTSRGSTNISEREVEEILLRTYGPAKKKTYDEGKVVYGLINKQLDESYDKQEIKANQKKTMTLKKKDEYLLVDGYNIIFAWENLKKLAEENLNHARVKLLDIMCNYQSQKGSTVIVVFDAYKVIGNMGSNEKYNNIFVVYTKEAETADQYIERLVTTIRPSYHVTVATSDLLEQVIIMGKGAVKMTAEGLKAEVEAVFRIIQDKFIDQEKNIKQQLPFEQYNDILKPK